MKNIGNEEKLISMIDKNSYQLRKTIIKLSEFLKTLEIRNPSMFHLIAAFDKFQNVHGTQIKPVLGEISIHLNALSPYQHQQIKLFQRISKRDLEKLMLLTREFNIAFLEVYLEMLDKGH